MKRANDRIFIANHSSMLGTAIARQVASQRHERAGVLTTGEQALDVRCPSATRDFLLREQPTQVYLPLPRHAAGAATNRRDSELMHSTLMAGANLMEQSLRSGVRRLVVVSTSRVYPQDAPAPLAEEDLLMGRPAPHCEAEALATVALIKLCESYNRDYSGTHGISYRCVVSATPFGPSLYPDPRDKGVIGSMIEQMHQAKMLDAAQVSLPFEPEERQEFLYTDDVAAAALYVMDVEDHRYASVTAPSRGFLNAGYGQDVSNQALAHSLADVVGYRGRIVFAPPSRAAGRSLRLDSHRLRSLGWRPRLAMEDALALTYYGYHSNHRALNA